MRILHLIVALGSGFTLSAGEFAVLTNGSRLHADRHQIEGPTVRLYTGDAVTQMPAGLVARFEAEEFVPPPAPPPPAPPPVAKPAALVVATPAQPTAPRDLAAAAAKKYGLPSSFVESVMKAESGFQPTALSPKGAIGLMQLMPGTARNLGVDPLNPQQNVEGGAQYLHDLLARYEDSPDQVLLALAAYNAGPAAVERYRGVPPYRETRQYILRILKTWDQNQLPEPNTAK